MDGYAHPQGFLNFHLRGFSCQLRPRPRHSLPPLLPHHLHPYLYLPPLPHLPLYLNFPLPREKSGLMFPSLTTRKGLSWAHDLTRRSRHSPLPHGLMTAHSSLL